MKIEDYKEGFRIVSIALDEQIKEDLLHDELDFLFVKDNIVMLLPDEKVMTLNEKNYSELSKTSNYDVYELWPDGSLHRCFDNRNNDNYFFVTGKCNSNCIMCPSPELARRDGNVESVYTLIEIAKHIPSDTNHLTITGGEPFMIGSEIFAFLQYLKEKFEETEFLLLTNGRIFAIQKYVDLMVQHAPNNLIVAIPLHGSTFQIHDQITNSKDSFKQTVKGIKRLLNNKIHVEIRIVISKLNVCDFQAIADFIIKELRGISYVSIVAMEMTGNARVNKDKVWISYKESQKKISNGIRKLIKNEIDVKLYNYPLCTVEPELWTLCEKSISTNKVRYADGCDICKVKKACGGVFAGTLSIEKDELEPII